MEFASEMIVKATLHGLEISEVPTKLARDGRSRPPHLRSWHDGWRHLRFLLIYSPRWLFLYPGVALMILGFLTMAWLLPGPRTLGGLGLDVDTLLYAATACIVGLQCFTFAVFTKIFGINAKLLPSDPQDPRSAAGFHSGEGPGARLRDDYNRNCGIGIRPKRMEHRKVWQRGSVRLVTADYSGRNIPLLRWGFTLCSRASSQAYSFWGTVKTKAHLAGELLGFDASLF